MNPTIQELAEALGVHKATVSRALGGKPGVSGRLRQRILRAAGRMGFYPNGQARSLATSRTETVALVFCDETSDFLTNPFYSKVLAGVAAETAQHSYSLAFCSLSSDVRLRGSALPKIMRERRADGFLFVGDQDDALIGYCHNLDYPLILVDHRYGGGRFDTVAIHNVAGARRAVEHLLELGHRRIGFVGGSLRSPSFRERLEGYRAALTAAGLAVDDGLVQLGESRGGHENMMKLLDLAEPPTAVFACNDANAVRAVKAARERGLRVPEDLSVVGFDDASCAIETWPHLTTMRVDAEEMGRLAVRRLVARINGHKGPAEESILVSRLVARDSTTFPKGARGGPHLEMRKQSENMIPCNLQGVPT